MPIRSSALISIAICTLMLCPGCVKKYTATKNPVRLETLIEAATQIADTAKEGPEPGLFPPGSVGYLRSIIDSARALEQQSLTQFGIDRAEILLQNTLTDFKNSVQEEKQFYFDGTGYLHGGNDTAFYLPAITLEAWVYPTERKNAMYLISTEGQNTGYKLQVPQKAIFVIGTGSQTKNITLQSPGDVQVGVWTHVAASYDGSSMKLYLNGELVAQKETTNPIVYDGRVFRIGEGSQFGGRTFKGRIRDVRIWDHALGDADIATSMTNKLTGTEGGLGAWWPLNLSSGNILFDRTGKHSVTLINMQLVDPL